MAYLAGVSGGTSVANGAAIPWTALINTPSGTTITATGTQLAAGQIIISNTGFYQISFGYENTTSASSKFSLNINGVTSTPQQSSTEQFNSSMVMMSTTIIVQLTTRPNTITLVNNSSAARTLNTPTSDSICAYMTFVKLQ
jgi:hypothetical protein